MKKIPLTQGKFALVDDEDFDFLNQWKWFVNSGYAARNGKAICCGNKRYQEKILMHRVINETPEGMDTDHINLDRLDNRRANLRSVTRSQNMCNKRIRSDSQVGFKGVDYHSGKWRVTIMHHGKRKCVGRFETKEEAALAYNRAALETYGEFARLNTVPLTIVGLVEAS